MDFSEDTKNRAFLRSGLKCECTSLSCGHIKKCGKALYRGNWHASYIKPLNSGGDNSLENCEVICNECYENQARGGETVEREVERGFRLR